MDYDFLHRDITRLLELEGKLCGNSELTPELKETYQIIARNSILYSFTDFIEYQLKKKELVIKECNDEISDRLSTTRERLRKVIEMCKEYRSKLKDADKSREYKDSFRDVKQRLLDRIRNNCSDSAYNHLAPCIEDVFREAYSRLEK
ncbi:MAG: hypothetical protein AABX16_04020 [Nanoarchaeota archaeon]